VTAPNPLYDPTFEHEACGVGFVARIDGRRSHVHLTTQVPDYAKLAEAYGGVGMVVENAGQLPFERPEVAAIYRLLDQLKFNRAIEVYLTQMMPVSEIALREGVRAFGAKKPMQVVVWEDLMDARCLLRTPKPSTPERSAPASPPRT